MACHLQKEGDNSETDIDFKTSDNFKKGIRYRISYFQSGLQGRE